MIIITSGEEREPPSIKSLEERISRIHAQMTLFAARQARLVPASAGDYYMSQYTAYQLMVDAVLRLHFRCDENNTKFQQHENLSLPSSHRNVEATFPKMGTNIILGSKV